MAICRNFTFDNFIVDPFNLEAIEQAKQFATTSQAGMLVIYGPPSVGKTHLSQAIRNSLKKTNPEQIITVIHASEFTEDLIQHSGENRYKDFKRKYHKEPDVLMVEDIHQLCGEEQTQIELLHIISHYQQTGKKIVLSFLGDSKDLELNNEQLKAILHDAKSVDIKAPIVETAMAILKQSANVNEVSLSPYVIEKVAQAYRHDVRRLVMIAFQASLYHHYIRADLSDEELLRFLEVDHLAL